MFHEITKVLMKNKATQETDVAEDLGRKDRHRSTMNPDENEGLASSMFSFVNH